MMVMVLGVDELVASVQRAEDKASELEYVGLEELGRIAKNWRAPLRSVGRSNGIEVVEDQSVSVPNLCLNKPVTLSL